MRFFCLFFAGLVVVSALQTSMEPQNEIRSMLMGVLNKRQSPLVETIKSLVDSGAPLDEILDLMYKIRNDILAEQDAHDNQYQKQKDTCHSQIDQKKDLIEKLESDLQDSQASIAELKGFIFGLNSEVEQKNHEIEENAISQGNAAQDIEKLKQYQNEHNEQFAINEKDHLDALDAIAEVVELLESSSLTSEIGSKAKQDNIRNVMNALAQHITSMKSISNKSNNILLFVDSIKSSSPSDVTKLLDLLSRLAEEIRRSLEELRNNHQALQDKLEQEFSDLKEEQESIIAQEHLLREELNDLESVLEEKKSQLGETEEFKTNTQDHLNAASKVLSDIEERCSNEDDDYKKETNRRIDELDTIDQCIEILFGLKKNRSIHNLPDRKYRHEENQENEPLYEEHEQENAEENEGNAEENQENEPLYEEHEQEHAEENEGNAEENHKDEPDYEEYYYRQFGDFHDQFDEADVVASSELDEHHGPKCASYNTPASCNSGAWIPAVDESGQFLVIDLHAIKLVVTVNIGYRVDRNGQEFKDQAVTKIKVSHSISGQKWTDYGVFDSETGEFVITSYMQARYIRLTVLDWKEHIAMRVKVIAANEV